MAATTVAKELMTNKQRIALVESTTGGLIGAALLKVPSASQFFVSSCVVYSPKGYKQFLGRNLMRASGVSDTVSNYSNEEKYIKSKEKFVTVCAKEMQKTLELEDHWVLVESGTVGPEFYIPGLEHPFTAIGIAGPKGYFKMKVLHRQGRDREENMNAFTEEALVFAYECLLEANKPKSNL